MERRKGRGDRGIDGNKENVQEREGSGEGKAR